MRKKQQITKLLDTYTPPSNPNSTLSNEKNTNPKIQHAWKWTVFD